MNIINKMRFKVFEFFVKRSKEGPVDKELLLSVTKLALEPMGKPKKPLYRNDADKKDAFKVIEGGRPREDN
ncbi:hypothetical protein [Bacillus sp. B-jedd]|uniref:hypothetical protein n=1 Tax=Bacillus sp. B-jedd TaxID=1476857 RepID=UPI000515572A|nr:hypothetical protein [Bacillus sp. B-jedd]CEG26463.1 hypothetical protein BN1002_01310 [Bacillus sp. B-jedd]